MRFDIAVVTVTYNPDWNVFFRRISQFCSQNAKVIWIDNASYHAQSYKILHFLKEFSNLIFVSLHKNLGLSAPLRLASILARRYGARYMIYFDQDSIPCPFIVDRYFQACQHAEKHSESGDFIILSNYIDVSPHETIDSQVKRVCHSTTGLVALGSSTSGILSGICIPLKTLDRIGGFSKDLVLDFLDYDIISRAKQEGVKLYRFEKPVMLQTIGKRYVFRTPLGNVYHIYHSPTRWMIIGTAMIDLYRKHVALDARYVLKITLRIVKKILKTLIFLRDFACFYGFMKGILIGFLPKRKKIRTLIAELNR